ncbi:sugar ABC transporter permease [candidate division KSB1 bacterium]|nr:sugar ABC transporter permease [candidate division KSB1 bacterium]
MVRSRSPFIYLALVPSFLLIAIFNYWPILSAFQHAFYQWDPGGTQRFIGIGNFIQLFQDPVFWKSVRNMFLIMLFSTTIKLAVPLITAVLIFHLKHETSRYYYRVLFIVPMVVPSMVTILIWNYIYSDGGVLDSLLTVVGLGRYAQAWLSSPRIALLSVLGVGFPFVAGFALLVFYAGLTNISETIFDVARLEGIRPVRRFFAIELPLLLRQVRVILVLTLLGAVQGYELILILTRGGPGYETMTPGLWMYLCGFSFNEMGYACSIGLVLFLFMLLLTITNLRWLQPQE